MFVAEAPDLVLHAAALKQVTLAEMNPGESVLTNVLGAWNVAASALEPDVSPKVMISTEKASPRPI